MLTVLTNNGSGGFVTAGTVAVSGEPFCVVAADVNGDGKPDLITADAWNRSLTILTNTSCVRASSGNNGIYHHHIHATVRNQRNGGDYLRTNFSATPLANIVYFGAVQAAVVSASPTNLIVIVPTGATFAPVTVTVNGLTAYASQPFLPTFAGMGQGFNSATFGPGQNLAAGNGPVKVIIADLDGDGKPDLAVANTYDHSISIYRNISVGGSLTAASFAPPVVLPTPTGSQSPYYLAVADLDGDGKLDIIASDFGDNLISIYRNISTPGSLTTNSFATRMDFGDRGNYHRDCGWRPRWGWQAGDCGGQFRGNHDFDFPEHQHHWKYCLRSQD